MLRKFAAKNSPIMSNRNFHTIRQQQAQQQRSLITFQASVPMRSHCTSPVMNTIK